MTLKEIAKKAGVSVATVSRVVNGNNEKAARKEIQEKIWEIVREEGYIPNSSAQNLKKTSGGNVICKNIACFYARDVDSKNDIFFTTISRNIEKEAVKEGFAVKYFLSKNDLKNQNNIYKERIDGIVILGRCDQNILKLLRKKYKKIVYCGMNDMVDVDCDQVICDGYKASLSAMNKLFDLGHTHIGYIGETKNEVRYDGYVDALSRHKISTCYTENVVDSSMGGYEGAKKMLSYAPDISAFFCMDDIIAIGAMRAVQEAGLIIPDQISVISMDDIEIAQFVSPMLDTVHIPLEELGKVTAKLLIDRINKGHTLSQRVELPFYIVERNSTRRNARL